MMVDGARTIEVNGIAHWVRVAGAAHAKTPLVLLHGGPGDNCHAYEAVGDRLAEQTTVVFYDQRGCGRSSAPADPSAYTFADFVSDLDELREALGVARMSLWGVSHGCLLAAEYAVAHRDRVAQLVLQAPSIVSPLHPGIWSTRPAAADTIAGPQMRAKLRAALSGVDDPVQRLWTTVELLADDPATQTRYVYHDPAIAATIPDSPDYGFNEQLCRVLIGTERAELLDELAELEIPTLVMVGLWDRNAGVDTSRDVAIRLGGKLHVFGHSAHMPHDEETDEYVDVVRAFVLAAGSATR